MTVKKHPVNEKRNSGIMWSQEKPEFELTGLVLPKEYGPSEKIVPDELYGEQFCFGFQSGSFDDIASLHSAIVFMRVYDSGCIDSNDSDNMATIPYLARQIFPLARSTETSGVLHTKEMPAFEELEIFAVSLAKILETKSEINYISNKNKEALAHGR